MIKRLLPLIAMPMAFVACAATAPLPANQDFVFDLKSAEDEFGLTATFRYGDGHKDRWSSSFTSTQLAGLDLGGFRSSGSRPLGFSVSRQSGVLRCAGTGGSGRASGRCRFAPDPEFASALAASGVSAPDHDEWIELFALDVRRDLLDTLGAAGFGKPSVDELVEMTAVGVDQEYIRAMASAGYRPTSYDSLVELKALGVTPQWIGDLARVGMSTLPVDDLAELKALGVDAAYIQGFRDAGYMNLTADQLVELKALGVTHDFAREVERHMGRQSPDRLVELKALGFAWRD